MDRMKGAHGNYAIVTGLGMLALLVTGIACSSPDQRSATQTDPTGVPPTPGLFEYVHETPELPASIDATLTDPELASLLGWPLLRPDESSEFLRQKWRAIDLSLGQTRSTYFSGDDTIFMWQQRPFDATPVAAPTRVAIAGFGVDIRPTGSDYVEARFETGAVTDDSERVIAIIWAPNREILERFIEALEMVALPD
jgi:hypothetical protein